MSFSSKKTKIFRIDQDKAPVRQIDLFYSNNANVLIKLVMYDSEGKALLDTNPRTRNKDNFTTINLEEGERIVGIRGHVFQKCQSIFDNLQFILVKPEWLLLI